MANAHPRSTLQLPKECSTKHAPSALLPAGQRPGLITMILNRSTDSLTFLSPREGA